MTVFDGVQTVFRRHHLDLIVLPCANDEDPADYLGRMVARGLVDAVIISATRRNDPRIPLLERAHIPFIALGRSANASHPWIDLDFEGVARRSVRRLVERGHRQIAVALPATDLNLGHIFLKGFKRGLKDQGIDFTPEFAIPTESSDEGGYQLGRTLLSFKHRPSAVVLSYELPAGGLYRALSEAGVAAGSEMAVIAFRESPATRHLVPRITSYTTSLRDLGVALGETLLSTMPEFSEAYSGMKLQRTWPMALAEGDSDPGRTRRTSKETK
jgi:DNA-binding LacI/PurR family transcriptional regulator